MTIDDLIQQVLRLEPAKRFEVVEEILRSLDQPDPEIEKAWLEEAEHRLAEYRAGKSRSIPAEDVFGSL